MGRTRGATHVAKLVWVVLLVASVSVAIPAASFGLADLDRPSGVDVTDDPTSTLGMTVSPGVEKGVINSLVELTNNLGTPLTITVALRQNDGDLYVDGVNYGTTATFPLAPGDSEVTSIEASANKGSIIVFDVSAVAPGVQAVVPGRSVEVVKDAGGGLNQTPSLTNLSASCVPDKKRDSCDVSVQVQDPDGDLDLIEYELRDAASGQLLDSDTDTSVKGVIDATSVSTLGTPNNEQKASYLVVVSAVDDAGHVATVQTIVAGSG